MAKIYLAYETERPTRQVALKVQITGQQHSLMFQDLLRDEANLLRTLRHPGVVRIVPMRLDNNKVSYVARAAGHPDMPWYYAMEYLGNQTLTQYINNFPDTVRMRSAKETLVNPGVYTIDWALELFYQILITVEFMHYNGIAHGDIKPDNIIFRRNPTANHPPQPVLIDFGSASLFDGMRQLTSSMGYSPPEVMTAVKKGVGLEEAENIDAEKIDIWSLGVILFEILAGRKMRPTKGMGFLSKTLIQPRDKKISRYRPEIHESVDKLLQVMLNDDPRDRPEVSQIITAIEEKIFTIRPPRIDSRRVISGES